MDRALLNLASTPEITPTLKFVLLIAALILLGGVSSHSFAQATATASRRTAMQIGGGWSFANPDYGGHRTQGWTVYGDLDLSRHWGIEGDIHRSADVTVSRVLTDSYLIGPRYVFHYKRIDPYAKAILGFGRFKYLDYDTAYTYKIYSLGGGLDLQATNHLNIRAIDFEYQNWPGFPPSGLAPTLFTSGAAYSF
jgi:hypothetical protein